MTQPMHDFAARLSFGDLPGDMVALLRRSFVDTMGVAAIGSTTDLSMIAKKAALALYGPGTAGSSRFLLDGRPVSPASAAMAGAFTIDSIDAHDGNTPNKGHAGSAIFPALLAVADAMRAQGHEMSGAEFAAHLALAYEISYRVGLVQHATCADYHTSGAWTAVGVAAAVARMIGADPEQIRHAAGIGEYHGPRSQMMRCIDFPTMVRDGVGWGAPTGVTAAYLAKEGFTGAPALTCESDEASPFWSDLGQNWLTLAHTHYKLYPCCRWAHPSIDAAQALMNEHDLQAADVQSVEIRTFHYATRLEGYAPQNLDELAYSIAFPVATMIVRGQIGPSELSPEALADPEILRISHATRLIDDPDLTERSVAQRWAALSLILKDGRRFDAPARTPRGDADQPLSDAEINAKFKLLSSETLAPDQARKIQDMCSSFDQLDAHDFSHLIELLHQK